MYIQGRRTQGKYRAGVDMIDWDSHEFHPVVDMPEDYTILDLSGGTWTPPQTDYSVGKYDELRPGLYSTELFSGERFLHIGIDIGAPVGTACMAFADGEISHFGYNAADGDYGHVVITKHILDGILIWALYGHLDSASIEGKSCLLYTSPSPRDQRGSRMPSSA